MFLYSVISDHFTINYYTNKYMTVHGPVHDGSQQGMSLFVTFGCKTESKWSVGRTAYTDPICIKNEFWVLCRCWHEEIKSLALALVGVCQTTSRFGLEISQIVITGTQCFLLKDSTLGSTRKNWNSESQHPEGVRRSYFQDSKYLWVLQLDPVWAPNSNSTLR